MQISCFLIKRENIILEILPATMYRFPYYRPGSNILNTCLKMVLLKYFARKTDVPVLPDPDGPLSSRVPSSAISSANKEVKCVLKDKEPDASRSKKRGQYASYTEEEKAKIAKRAAEMGVTSTIRHF